LKPPALNWMDSPESTASWTWDCFAAESLPALWAEDPDNEELRFLIARLVFAPHHVAIKILFQRCAERRAALGIDFDFLRRLIFEWAHMMNRISFVRYARQYSESLTDAEFKSFSDNVDAWGIDRVSKFIRRELPPTVENWRDMDQWEHFSAVDDFRERFGNCFLEFGLIRAAHEWLPSLDQALNKQERKDWITFWRSALNYLLSQISGERHGYPDEDECWVLDGIAASLPFMDPEEQPEDLWHPILDLSRESKDWPEVFLSAFHRVGLNLDPIPESFMTLRAAMVEYVFTNPQDDSSLRWNIYDDVWQALIGIDGGTRRYWEPRHQRIVDQNCRFLERWMEVGARYGHHLMALSSWLGKEAADPIRLIGVVWLDRVIIRESDKSIYNQSYAENAVASLLSVTLQRDESHLRGNAVASAAFRRLLQWLVDLQNPVALELMRMLGNL